MGIKELEFFKKFFEEPLPRTTWTYLV